MIDKTMQKILTHTQLPSQVANSTFIVPSHYYCAIAITMLLYCNYYIKIIVLLLLLLCYYYYCANIVNQVLPFGSTCGSHTTEWQSYNRVAQLPNVASHGIVNHSVEFIDQQAGVHMNHIQLLCWKQSKNHRTGSSQKSSSNIRRGATRPTCQDI